MASHTVGDGAREPALVGPRRQLRPVHEAAHGEVVQVVEGVVGWKDGEEGGGSSNREHGDALEDRAEQRDSEAHLIGETKPQAVREQVFIAESKMPWISRLVRRRM